MTHRHELTQHRLKLAEIRKIMESMKTLAFLETHKLAQRIQAQHQIDQLIQSVATDFLKFNPQLLPPVEAEASLILLIGSQRGFCGNFNERLLQYLNNSSENFSNRPGHSILVGSKLHNLLQAKDTDMIFLEGANVAEEINQVVEQLVGILSQKRQPLLTLQVIFQNADGEISQETLLPPFVDLDPDSCPFNHPPCLNTAPAEFLIELTDYYLFTALHRILYDSLMAENQQRLQHLEQAVSHLDDKTETLTRKANALRQEEIIEEIEVILLNAAAP